MARQRNIDGIATALGMDGWVKWLRGFNLGEKDIISWACHTHHMGGAWPFIILILVISSYTLFYVQVDYSFKWKAGTGLEDRGYTSLGRKQTFDTVGRGKFAPECLYRESLNYLGK